MKGTLSFIKIKICFENDTIFLLKILFLKDISALKMTQGKKAYPERKYLENTYLMKVSIQNTENSLSV